MNLEEVAKILEAVSEGADQSAVKVVQRTETMLKIANSEPSVIQAWDRTVYEIFLGKDERVFALSLEAGNPEEVVRRARDILSMASKVDKSPFYAPLPPPSGASPRAVLDETTLEKAERMGELGELMISAAQEEGAERVAGMLSIAKIRKLLATSTGVSLEEESSSVEAYLRAFAGEDGSGQWSLGGTRLDERELEEMARRAGRYAVMSRGRKGIEPGRYDVVLSPMVMGNLIDVVADSASAFMILMGMSFFQRNKPGDAVASEVFSLIDDPEDPDLPESTGFDDEGLPTRRKYIIESGVLRTILHNSATAKVMKAEPTGNAGWLMPHAWNYVVPAGDMGEEEMIAELKRGIVITNNWYTRLQNYVEGTFSTIARDAVFYVENGEIKYPLGKIRIADTFPHLLKNIRALGREIFKIKWWEVPKPSKLPFALIEDVNISLPKI